MNLKKFGVLDGLPYTESRISKFQIRNRTYSFGFDDATDTLRLRNKRTYTMLEATDNGRHTNKDSGLPESQFVVLCMLN